jgi:FkbM family methyltransferase
MKKFLKSIFASLGYEIRNKRYKDIFTIRQTMEESLEQIKSLGFYPDLVIDIGAADGTPPLQTCFPKADFFWVEPLAEFRDSLEALKQKYKGDYVIAAMGKKPGELDIQVKGDKVGSSLLANAGESDNLQESRKIKVITLKDLATEKFSSFQRAVLKVDVQGYELEVLEGAGDFLHRIDVIILEVSFFKFLKDCPEFYDVVDYMKKKSFVVYDIIGGINRPLDHALGQKDLVFVKENGRFRQSHNWE